MASGSITFKNIPYVKRAIVFNNSSYQLSVGQNTINFSFPSDYDSSLGVIIARAWPASTWTNAYVTMVTDDTIVTGQPTVGLFSNSNQAFHIRLELVYIASQN